MEKSWPCYEAMESYVMTKVWQWFHDGPFFLALRSGHLTHEDLQHFATQYGHYSRHFPRLLGAAIAAMPPDDRWWIPLADNLWDEAGRGMEGRSHQNLYARFLASTGADLALDQTPMESAVANAIERPLTFLRRATPLEAMAAIGLGSELFAGSVMGWILEGLRHHHYQEAGSLDLSFWEIHVAHDEPRHYALCKSVLEAHAAPEQWRHLVAVGLYVACWEARMYTGIGGTMPSGRLYSRKG